MIAGAAAQPGVKILKPRSKKKRITPTAVVKPSENLSHSQSALLMDSSDWPAPSASTTTKTAMGAKTKGVLPMGDTVAFNDRHHSMDMERRILSAVRMGAGDSPTKPTGGAKPPSSPSSGIHITALPNSLSKPPKAPGLLHGDPPSPGGGFPSQRQDHQTPPQSPGGGFSLHAPASPQTPISMLRYVLPPEEEAECIQRLVNPHLYFTLVPCFDLDYRV